MGAGGPMPPEYRTLDLWRELHCDPNTVPPRRLLPLVTCIQEERKRKQDA